MLRRRKATIKALALVLGTALLVGCGQYGTDYCANERRRIPDREKILRYVMVQYTGELSGQYVWQDHTRRAPDFDQWMAREVPNPSDRPRVEAAINQYLDDHPNFIQMVGRKPFVRNYDNDKYLRDAVKAGYYSDIVIMEGRGSDYPKFREDRKYQNGYSDVRRGITNCGEFINWQLVGG